MKKIILALILFVGASPAAFSQIVRSTTFTKVPKEKAKTEWFLRLGLSCNNLTGEAKKLANEYFEDNLRDGASAKFGTRANFEFMVGFNKYFGKSNVYWGMELGVGTRGGSFTSEYEYETEMYNDVYKFSGENKCYVNTYNVKYVPFTVGYKFPINKDFKIDAHLGLFISVDFGGSYAQKGWSNRNGDKDSFEDSFGVFDEGVEYSVDCIPPDAGLQLGIGVWYRHVNLNFTWQRGFAPYLGSFPAGSEWENSNGDHAYFSSSNAVISVAYAF